MMGCLKLVVGAVIFAAALWFGVHWYAEYRVRTAFADAGMSEKASRCMGRRLTRKLTLLQIRKLEALQTEDHSLGSLRRAVRQIDDGQVVKVTITSMALCSMGIAS